MQLDADSSVQLEADDMDLALPLVIDNNGEIHLQVYDNIDIQTNKNGSVVRNEDLQRLKDMIKKLRSKLKWLEKLGFISLSSIVLILIYNLFVGRRR